MYLQIQINSMLYHTLAEIYDRIGYQSTDVFLTLLILNKNALQNTILLNTCIYKIC
jgi:hypothetical protein